MLECKEIITVIQRTYDQTSDKSIYKNTVIRGVSWHGKTVVELQDKGLRSANVFTVRIPESVMSNIVIAEGDYIVRGIIRKEITGQKDLDGLDYITVVSVGNNIRGRSLRHIVVVGKG